MLIIYNISTTKMFAYLEILNEKEQLFEDLKLKKLETLEFGDHMRDLAKRERKALKESIKEKLFEDLVSSECCLFKEGTKLRIRNFLDPLEYVDEEKKFVIDPYTNILRRVNRIKYFTVILNKNYSSMESDPKLFNEFLEFIQVKSGISLDNLEIENEVNLFPRVNSDRCDLTETNYLKRWYTMTQFILKN
jgi:hypothetical protein